MYDYALQYVIASCLTKVHYLKHCNRVSRDTIRYRTIGYNTILYHSERYIDYHTTQYNLLFHMIQCHFIRPNASS